MSRYGGDPRSSGSNLGYGGGGGGGGGERWDPERFARERDRMERSRGPPMFERERFEEHDRFESRGSPQGGGWRRESVVDDITYNRGGGRGERFEERDIIFSEDRYGPPARRPRGGPQRYYDDDMETIDSGPTRGQMVPFQGRRPSMNAERGHGPPNRRAHPRPGIIRRQSSLDTFDRKPMLRYGDRIREPPETIVIPTGGRRRRSPPRYVERDYEEEIRIAEPEYYGDDNFRGYREREIETVRRRRGGDEVEFKEEEFEVEVEPEKPYPRKGKTKMPKRLVHKRALLELGYPYEEEGETIIILKALGKEHIDEVISISKSMKEPEQAGESRTTYLIEAPPEAEVVERRTTEIIVSPPPAEDVPRSVRDWDDGHRSEKGGGLSEHGGGKSVKGGGDGHSTRARSRSRSRSEKRDLSPVEIVRKPSRSHRRSKSTAGHKSEYFEEDFGESNSMHGPLALIQPKHHHHKDERSIKAEIRALEAEKEALKLERKMEKEHRKAERYRDEEIIIERRDDVVKIEKDRKAPDSRLVRAMLATLT